MTTEEEALAFKLLNETLVSVADDTEEVQPALEALMKVAKLSLKKSERELVLAKSCKELMRLVVEITPVEGLPAGWLPRAAVEMRKAFEVLS